MARQILGLSFVDFERAIRRSQMIIATVHGRKYVSEQQLALLAAYDPETFRFRATPKIDAPVNQ